MDIRQARKEEYNRIYELVKVAFETAEESDGDEQDFVLELRKREDYIPELELIAVEEDEIIGHIMLTKQRVKTDDGEYIGLLLAPLCVKLEFRNEAVGERLVWEAFARAKQLGYKAVFLVGYPKYYKKFGFKEIAEFGIENKTEIPNEFVLGCEIVQGSLINVRGIIDKIE